MNPWIVDILLVLSHADPRTGMTEGDLVWNLRIVRNKPGVKRPEAFDAVVRSCINHHTSQSSEWIKDGSRPENDILYSPKGKGVGHLGDKAPRSSNG
jgi:Leu/Phe-tRNA-protein transferase